MLAAIVIILVGVGVAIGLSQGGSGKSKSAAAQSATPTDSCDISCQESSALNTDEPTDDPTDDDTQPAAPTGLSVGDTEDISQSDDSGDQDAEGKVKVTKIYVGDSGRSESGPPENGNFLVIKLTVRGVSGAIEFNPDDFYITGSGGSHYEDATFNDSYGSTFDDVTVHAGETASGTIVYDVPHGALRGKFYYSPNADEKPIAYWTYKAS